MQGLLIIVVIKREVIQLLEVKELGEGHVQRACNLMEIHNAGIAGSAIDDIVDRRLPHIAHPGKLIDRDPALLAQAADAVCVDFAVVHKNTPYYHCYPNLVNSMIIWDFALLPKYRLTDKIFFATLYLNIGNRGVANGSVYILWTP